jgi:phosphatidyl-myo-inositol alpha-mannosyltransferase
MNIALTSLYLPGDSKIGVGYQVHGLANALVKRGHRVTVFSQCESGAGAAYEAVVVPARRQWATFGFAWDLREVDFSGFDVLNAHGDDWFLWGRRRPWHVHTYHGSCLAEMLNAHGLKAKLRMGVLAACEYNSLLLCDKRVTVSENTRRYIPGIQHVIPCGVQTQRYRPGGAKADRPTVLFVGTMHGRKRGRMLLELFERQVRTAVPGAELWCVCDRPTDLQPAAGVKFFGRIPEEELIALYRQAWVFCLPSTYEGFGVPYIEAMASGTAVVATPNPGAVEVTQNGRSGRVCEDEGLGPALVELLTDRGERERLVGVGLVRAQDFDWATVCERYEALYGGSTTRDATREGASA